MSDPLASTLAELRRRLEADRPTMEDEAGPTADRDGQTDLWQLSEMELDRLMGRRLEELHRLLPPNPDLPVPPQSLPRRLRRCLPLMRNQNPSLPSHSSRRQRRAVPGLPTNRGVCHASTLSWMT